MTSESARNATAVATVVIAAILGVAAFTWLGPVLKPFLVAVFLFYATESAAKALVGMGLRPATAYAACLILAIVGVILLAQLAYRESQIFLEKWPQYEQRLDRAVSQLRIPEIAAFDRGAPLAPAEPNDDSGSATEALATKSTSTALVENVQRSSRLLLDYLFRHSLDIVEPLVLVLVYLLFLFLESRKLPARTMRAFPGEQGRRLLEIEEGITESMERFMSVKTLVGAGMAVAAGAIMLAFGVDHWLLWSVAFFLSNYVTYIGSAAACVPPIVLAFLNLHPFAAAAVAALLVINRLIWIDIVEVRAAGKSLNLDPVVVFLWLAYWGWVWGVLGLLLAYPMLAAVKVVLMHFPTTRGLAVLLGDEE